MHFLACLEDKNTSEYDWLLHKWRLFRKFQDKDQHIYFVHKIYRADNHYLGYILDGNLCMDHLDIQIYKCKCRLNIEH
jgi:hypothetical protein